MSTAKIGNYRWTICALLFFATTVNYLDRQVLSLLSSHLEDQFNWTNSDYANITAAFQLVYAFAMLFAGRIVDRLDTKWGYAVAIIVWSLGAILHALALPMGEAISTLLGFIGFAGLSVSVIGFVVSRAVLAIGEAGNFPAAIKATAEYFPKKERSLATGIFNSGANVGAILAPLTVPFIAKAYGWEAAFIIIGAFGFVWLAFWLFLYKKPSQQDKLSAAELAYILSDQEEQKVAQDEEKKTSWFKLLSFKQTWAFAFGKFMTDGVWWFFLFWLPSFLKAQYGMVDTQVALPISILYCITVIGSIGGGWFPAYFLKRGYNAYEGRMKAMLVIAIFPLVILLAQPLGHISYWLPVLLIAVGASAHQAWSANIFTTVSDMFPKKAVGSVVGIGGMAGGLGGVIVSKIGGWLFDSYKMAGIAQSWAAAKAQGLGEYLAKIQSIKIIDKYGAVIDLNKTELKRLSETAIGQYKAVDANLFDKLLQIQKPLVQAEMATSYTIMFAYCAVAYILAWSIMKILVPKMKIIEL